MTLKSDENALEGLPLQLLIISIIIAISLPLAYVTFEYYDRTQTEQNLWNEMDKVIGLAIQLSGGDTGNSETVEINIRNGFMTKVEEVIIGDSPGGHYRSEIRYKLSNRGTETVPHDANIFLATNDGGLKGLSIKGSGTIHLILEHKSGVDFDDDGISDTYIEISIIQ